MNYTLIRRGLNLQILFSVSILLVYIALLCIQYRANVLSDRFENLPIPDFENIEDSKVRELSHEYNAKVDVMSDEIKIWAAMTMGITVFSVLLFPLVFWSIRCFAMHKDEMTIIDYLAYGSTASLIIFSIAKLVYGNSDEVEIIYKTIIKKGRALSSLVTFMCLQRYYVVFCRYTNNVSLEKITNILTALLVAAGLSVYSLANWFVNTSDNISENNASSIRAIVMIVMVLIYLWFLLKQRLNIGNLIEAEPSRAG